MKQRHLLYLLLVIISAAGCSFFRNKTLRLPGQYAKMVKLCTRDDPDFDAIGELYRTALQPFVLLADSTADPRLLSVIEKGRQDKDSRLQAMDLHLSLQAIVYQKLLQTLAILPVMRISGFYQMEGDNLAAFYECLSPLVVDQGKLAGRDFDSICRLNIDRVRPFPFSSVSREAAGSLEDILLRIFVMALKEQIVLLKSGPAACEPVRFKAEKLFWTIAPAIEEELVRSDLADQLETACTDPDYPALMTLLKKAFPLSSEPVSVEFKGKQ